MAVELVPIDAAANIQKRQCGKSWGAFVKVLLGSD